MKRILLVCLILSLATSLFSQVQSVDSLENVLNTQKISSKEKLSLYHQICDEIAFYDPEKTMEYAKKGLVLAQKEKDILMQSYFYEYLGFSYNFKQERDSSIISFEKSLDLAIKVKHITQETKLYNNLGAANQSNNNLIKALDYYMKALDMCDKTNNQKHKAMILGNIGSIHLLLSNKTRALYFLEQARVLAEETNYPTAKIRAYCDLANIYSKNGEYDKALDYGWKTVFLCKEDGNKNFHTTALSVLAGVYYELQDYDNAQQCADTCLLIAEEFGDPLKIQAALMRLSEIYIKEKRYEECETVALRAWSIDSMNEKALTLSFNLGIASLYMGNIDRASYYLHEHRYLDLMLTDKNFQETLMNMEVKYETEKKEMRISALETEKQLYVWLAIAGALALLMSLGILFYRHRLHVQKQKMMEQEKQLVASQAILDGETAERSRLAHDLHDGLGGMLSVVKLNLEPEQHSKAMKMLDESIVELRRIAHHMMPESLVTYGLKVSLEDFCRAIPNAHFQFIGKDFRLDPRLEVMLYRCAYELINNAVKYANASNINVQLVVEEKIIALTVDDDGIGFDPDNIVSGTGLENLRTRVLAYNGKITVRSVPNEGTEIIIEIESI